MKVTIEDKGKITTVEGDANTVWTMVESVLSKEAVGALENSFFSTLFGQSLQADKELKTKKNTEEKKKKSVAKKKVAHKKRTPYKLWTAEQDQIVYEAYMNSTDERMDPDIMRELVILTGHTKQAICARASEKGWTYNKRKFKLARL